jgi:hypothetical protein
MKKYNEQCSQCYGYANEVPNNNGNQQQQQNGFQYFRNAAVYPE